MKQQTIEMLATARNFGIETLKVELQKLDRNEIKKAAKANGNRSTYGRASKDEIIEILIEWINSKLNYGTCFRMELIKELEEENK